jgi:hypothetical protein
MKTETELKFLEWFNEIESFGLRSERFYDEVTHKPSRAYEWLKAAFEAGADSRFPRAVITKQLPALFLPKRI